MRSHFVRKFIFMVFFGTLMVTESYAQNQDAFFTKAATKTAKPKETKATLNFEDELVEGNTQKPELFYLFQKKNFNYKRLIKLRENFLPEMRKTTEDIQRVRSGN